MAAISGHFLLTKQQRSGMNGVKIVDLDKTLSELFENKNFRGFLLVILFLTLMF